MQVIFSCGYGIVQSTEKVPLLCNMKTKFPGSKNTLLERSQFFSILLSVLFIRQNCKERITLSCTYKWAKFPWMRLFASVTAISTISSLICHALWANFELLSPPRCVKCMRRDARCQGKITSGSTSLFKLRWILFMLQRPIKGPLF